MIRVLLLAACAVCVACISWAESFRVINVGGCSAIEFGSRPSRSEATNVERFCERVVASGSFNRPLNNRYKLFVKYLVAAHATAESAHCGNPGCLSPGRRSRLYVLPEAEAIMAIRRDDAHLEVVLTTGYLDLIFGTAAYLALDGRDDDRAFTNLNGLWGSYRSVGGKRCTWDMVTVPLSGAAFMQRLEADQQLDQIHAGIQLAMLLFMFSHEFAHIERGALCGGRSSDGAMEIEQRCDRVAFDALGSWRGGGGLLPIAIIALLMSKAHYEALYYEPLGRIHRRPLGPSTLYAIFPARNWTERAKAILRHWDDVCSNGGRDIRSENIQRICSSRRRSVTRNLRSWTEKTMPTACQAN